MTLSSAARGGVVRAGGRDFRCAIGRGGLSTRKHEGDGATPVGTFLLRRAFFRADRMARPRTGLTTIALKPCFAWCEVPQSPRYNTLVPWVEASGRDRLWRDDHLYDVIIEIGYNDAPVLRGRGSAIFLHLARPGYMPTAGCIAVSRRDMARLLPRLGPRTTIRMG